MGSLGSCSWCWHQYFANQVFNPCRSHLGRLGHIGHRAVSLCQLVLNPIKGTESVPRSRAAVLSVAVPLSPGLEEDRQCTDIGLPHCLHKSQDVRDDVAVHIAGTKAWSLTLVLKHNSVPVPVLDPVEAVGCVPVERLPSWGAAFCGGGEASAFSNLANHTVNSIATSGVAVAKEEDFLVGVAVSGCALFWESRIRVGAGESGAIVSVCGAGRLTVTPR